MILGRIPSRSSMDFSKQWNLLRSFTAKSPMSRLEQKYEITGEVEDELQIRVNEEKFFVLERIDVDNECFVRPSVVR